MDQDKLDILRDAVEMTIQKAKEIGLEPLCAFVFTTDEDARDAAEWISQEYPDLRFICTSDPFGITMEDPPYGPDRYKPCPN
jgi:hypothetical protein